MITTKELFDRISRSLAKNKPLSVIRYGDGEYLVMTGVLLSESIHNVPYKKHLGFVPDKTTRQQISDNLHISIDNTDIVGVTQNTGKQWGSTSAYISELAKNKAVCSSDYHTELLRSGYLHELLLQCKKLAIISGHDLIKPIQDKYPNIERIIHFKIPLQPRYFGNQGQVHYPDVFNNVIDEIKHMDLSGFLCLVGAGFIGKPYLNYLKSSGGTAVDIGSVFDRLAGFITRGRYKGTKSTEYKI